MTAAAPAPRRRMLLKGLGVAALIVLTLLAALWLNRRAAAREVLVGWLERQGVRAQVDVERIELDGVTARIRLGDPANPQVVVERAEIDYALGAPWSATGLGLTPSRIRLVRPVVRASLRDGRLSFGELDGLIRRFRSRPPSADQAAPVILIENGRVLLDSDFGRATLNADARLENGRLMRLRAFSAPADFASGDIAVRRAASVLDLTTTGDRITGRLGLSAASARAEGFEGAEARLGAAFDLPYPDLKAKAVDGAARLNAVLAGDGLAIGAMRAREANLRLRFDGRATGWIDTLALTGDASSSLAADRLDLPGASASAAIVRLDRARAGYDRRTQRWSAQGPVVVEAGRMRAGGLDLEGARLTSSRLTLGGRGAALEAAGPIQAAMRRFRFGDLSLIQASIAGSSDLRIDQGWRLNLNARAQSQGGAWPLFGAIGRDDPDELKAMKRALGDFRLSIPALSLSTGDSGTRTVLGAEATLTPANGGALIVRPAGRPVFEARAGQRGGGALSVIARRGRGLPEAAFAVDDWRLTPGGFQARLDGRARLDFGLARGVDLTTRGLLANADGRLTYVADGCGAVGVDRLELGENDAVGVTGRLCPVASPLIEVRDGRWRARGQAREASASLPFLDLRLTDLAATFDATGGPAGLGLTAQVARGQVIDALEPRRFNPLSAAGSVRLADERWTGAFDLSREGHALGRLSLSHDGRTEAGGVTIDAPAVRFEEGGLQPSDLSPLAQALGSPATGEVGFTGRLDWTKAAEGTSSGRLEVRGLDFVSPAGPAKGLRGTIDFTSLAPLRTAPDQRLTLDSVEAVAPLTDVQIGFALDDQAATIAGGQVSVGGGVARLEPTRVPLTGGPMSATLVLEGVQLGDLVAGSGFGDKVKLDAVVSGRLPLTFEPARGWRVTGGTLQAIQPGRLSIQREALSDLEAGGGGEGVAPNTVQDLAYQAMENLAFDVLSAEVNSLDQGRLGVLFHIRGRHDPPVRQELRLTWLELIQRDFLNRELPLPSGTQIDLTLDTTLNVNQLVSDLLAINRARNGEDEAP